MADAFEERRQVNASWIQPRGERRINAQDEGMRPSGARLLGLVDQNDPALLEIADALKEMRDAGAELDEETVHLAIRIGRNRHNATTGGGESVEEPTEVENVRSIVYYARRSGLVKIGTTTRPEARFAAILPDEILAWEPGRTKVERARHAQFADYRLGGSEYFVMHDELVRHMDSLRSLHGQPDPDWPTLATLSRMRPRGGSRLVKPPVSARLVTVMEGVAELGIKRNTVDVWVRRKALTPTGYNEKQRPLYRLDHMAQLAAESGLIPSSQLE